MSQAAKSSHPACESAVHALDTRTSVLETKIGYVEDRLEDQCDKLDDVCDVMHSVKEHIAKQNGALPRIEEYTRRTNARIDQLEIRETKDTIASVKEDAKLDKQGTINRVKTRAIIVISSILFGSVMGAVFTTLFNNFFGG